MKSGENRIRRLASHGRLFKAYNGEELVHVHQPNNRQLGVFLPRMSPLPVQEVQFPFSKSSHRLMANSSLLALSISKHAYIKQIHDIILDSDNA